MAGRSLPQNARIPRTDSRRPLQKFTANDKRYVLFCSNAVQHRTSPRKSIWSTGLDLDELLFSTDGAVDRHAILIDASFIFLVCRVLETKQVYKEVGRFLTKSFNMKRDHDTTSSEKDVKDL